MKCETDMKVKCGIGTSLLLIFRHIPYESRRGSRARITLTNCTRFLVGEVKRVIRRKRNGTKQLLMTMEFRGHFASPWIISHGTLIQKKNLVKLTKCLAKYERVGNLLEIIRILLKLMKLLANYNL